MSILSSLLRDVAALFFPPRCPVCGRMLAQGEHTVCTLCRATAPLTGFWRQADNPVLGRCRDMLPVERASGLLYYVHGSGWRELIRGFKYRGAWRTARAMGEWYGRCLKESGLYDDVEVVVPLPLHPVKRCRRGYNQSEYIAEGIAAQLGVEVQILPLRRLGKCLPCHPVRLDVQRVYLGRRRVQPHRQVAVRLRREPCPLGKRCQQGLIDLLCGLHTTAPLTIPPR